jgi:CBS domain-containing protein
MQGLIMKVHEVMTSQVRCAGPATSIAEAAAELKRLNVGALPVCEADGELLGIITDRDIAVGCVAAGLNPRGTQVRDYMTCNPIAVGPADDVSTAFRLMAHEQIHRLPVIDQERKVIGMLSLGDCAVNCTDDRAVAELVRHISVPVRSTQPSARAA